MEIRIGTKSDRDGRGWGELTDEDSDEYIDENANVAITFKDECGTERERQCIRCSATLPPSVNLPNKVQHRRVAPP